MCPVGNASPHSTEAKTKAVGGAHPGVTRMKPIAQSYMCC